MEVSGFSAWRAGVLTRLTHWATFFSLCLHCMRLSAECGHVKCFLRQHAWKCTTNQTLELSIPTWMFAQCSALPQNGKVKVLCIWPFNPACFLLYFHSPPGHIWQPFIPSSNLRAVSHAMSFSIQGRSFPRPLGCHNVRIPSGKYDLLGREVKTHIDNVFSMLALLQ